ncbi:MAG: biotin transporter BioY [Ruminococcus sp.]|jgi:biotin transport system substrate-specific component|nr:biotin transporter BioY [Ruminococcus sp.]
MKNVKMLCIAAILTAVMAVMSNIAIPFSGIVLSLGTLGIFLTGMMLTPRYALLSTGAYLLLGICGAPIFASFSSGIGTFLGPTGGFLVAYPIMAFVTSLGFSREGIFRRIIAVIAALTVCYSLGGGWYAYYSGVGFVKSLTIVALPFILFDIGKAVLAMIISGSVKRLIKM